MSVNHGGTHALLMKREDLWIGGGVELLKQGGGGGGWSNGRHHALCLYSNLVLSFTVNCVVRFVSSYIMHVFTFDGIKS